MAHDSRQPEDSRIGPPSEDSRNDLEADLAFRERSARDTRARDSELPRRRSYARAAPSRRRWWLAAAALLLVASAFILWKARSSAAQLPALPSEASVADLPLAASGEPPSPAGTAASAPTQWTIRASLEDVHRGVTSAVTFVQTLLERQQSQSETLARLERDVSAIAAAVTQMKEAQEQQAAAAAAARSQARRVARAAARPVAAASAPRPAAQLLSIDMWDGKPSVVIGSTDRPDVRFLREGDQQAGVTVRQADPRRQRAVFDVGGELVELARDAR